MSGVAKFTSRNGKRANLQLGTLGKFAYLVFIAGICASSFGQEQILWQENYLLTWKDFKGTVPINTTAAATTASGISYDFSTATYQGNIIVDFKVYSFFYPSKSWYKPKLSTEITLAHEQLHFDITELYARKFRERLTAAKFTDNIKEEVRELYKKTLRQLNDFQNKYDSETDYSRNPTVQKRWEKEIKKALEE